MKIVICAALVGAFLVNDPSRAGVYTVDANGNGDFADLQLAILSVPPGSTLVLTSDFVANYARRYLIDRSLQIVGRRGIQTTVCAGLAQPVADQNAVFWIQAGPADQVLFKDLWIEGADWGAQGLYAPDGIRIESCGAVVIDDCIVEAGHAPACCWDEVGIDAGDAVRSNAPSRLFVARSELRGDDCSPHAICAASEAIGVPGGHGLNAPLSEAIVVVDSIVSGGKGGNVEKYDTTCYNGPPTLFEGGDGGHGIVGNAYVSNSILAGGGGGVRIYHDTDWGVGNDGVPGLPILGQHIAMENHLFVFAAGYGESATVGGAGYQAASVAVLFYSSAIATPFLTGLGPWFLEPPTFPLLVLTDPVGGFVLQGDVPNDLCLSGVTLYFQATDGRLLSEPDWLVIGHSGF